MMNFKSTLCLSVLLSLSSFATGCAKPAEPLEPTRQIATYPDVVVETRLISLDVVDERSGAVQTRWAATDGERAVARRRVTIPESLERVASARLQRVTAGRGPTLDVKMKVRYASATFVERDGQELARVSVALSFEVYAPDGTLLQEGSAQSQAELPESAASPGRMAQLVESTSLEAFDWYWASEQTLRRLNKKWNAHRATL